MAKSKKPSDTSEVVKISDVASKFEVASLKGDIDLLVKKNLAQAEIILGLQQENAHLKQLLQGAVPLLDTVMRLSDEEVIANQQLQRLLEASQNRQLSLEETKQFDLLVKNKRLARNQATNVVDVPKLPQDKSSLIKLARIKTDDGN